MRYIHSPRDVHLGIWYRLLPYISRRGSKPACQVRIRPAWPSLSRHASRHLLYMQILQCLLLHGTIVVICWCSFRECSIRSSSCVFGHVCALQFPTATCSLKSVAFLSKYDSHFQEPRTKIPGPANSFE